MRYESRMRGILLPFRRLLADRRGAAAVEFAFIAPVLLSLYFVTMEVSQGIEANKKVARVGSIVADLVTQQPSIMKSEIDAIMRIGEGTLQPYNRSKPEIIITAIEVTDEATPKVRVVWSRKLVNGAFSAGAAKLSTTTVPEKLNIRNSFLIRVESKLTYTPVITWTADQKAGLGLAAAFDGISMKENYYLRPRQSMTIPCTDC
ncbi:MAG: TadE/TadG family type IV pilus assembly protein [Rhizobiaceae bacterium]